MTWCGIVIVLITAVCILRYCRFIKIFVSCIRLQHHAWTAILLQVFRCSAGSRYNGNVKSCHCSADSKYNSNEWCCSYRATYYTLLPSHSSPGLYLDESKFVTQNFWAVRQFLFVSLGGGLLGRKVNKFLYSLYYCIVNKDEVVWERQEMMIINYSVKIRY